MGGSEPARDARRCGSCNAVTRPPPQPHAHLDGRDPDGLRDVRDCGVGLEGGDVERDGQAVRVDGALEPGDLPEGGVRDLRR